MPQERLDLLKLPRAVGDGIDDLVWALKNAVTVEDVEREGALQIAFILGLETAKRLKPADIEALYMIFDDAVRDKLGHMKGQQQ